MDMEKFKDEKRRIMLKWGDRLVDGSPKEMEAIHEEIAPLCKFAKMRAEKMLNGMAQAWLRGER